MYFKNSEISVVDRMISVEENITVLVYEGAVSWCLELKKGGRNRVGQLETKWQLEH